MDADVVTPDHEDVGLLSTHCDGIAAHSNPSVAVSMARP
jgi:hypothetical protein